MAVTGLNACVFNLDLTNVSSSVNQTHERGNQISLALAKRGALFLYYLWAVY